MKEVSSHGDTLQLNEWACLQWNAGAPRGGDSTDIKTSFIKLIRFIYMTCCFCHFVPVYINVWAEVFLFTCLLRRGCCKMSNRSRMPSNFASSPMHFTTKSEIEHTHTFYFLDLYHILQLYVWCDVSKVMKEHVWEYSYHIPDYNNNNK